MKLAFDHLVSDLAHPSSEVRAAAAYTLGQYGEQWATVALLHMLTDPDATVREEAAYALGELEDVGAVAGLVVACDDADAAVRRTATEALVKLRTHRDPQASRLTHSHQDGHTGGPW